MLEDVICRVGVQGLDIATCGAKQIWDLFAMCQSGDEMSAALCSQVSGRGAELRNGIFIPFSAPSLHCHGETGGDP